MAEGRRRLRILVTRPRAQAEELAARLADLGHEPVVCPLIELEPLSDELLDCSGYDWVVVTSANAATELARRSRAPLPKVAAIGPGTAHALQEQGIEPALVPAISTQEGLVAEFPRPRGRVLFAGAEGARRHLADELGADFLPLYRTVELRPKRIPNADLAVLASASAARALASLSNSVPAVSIGPETSRAARAEGIEIVEEALRHDLDGLVEAVARAAVRLPACSSPS
ncbi:MAG: uroporphyrinogen-III synthase [Gaiellaceae bacterium]